ncbi:MAG: CDP-glycerol glycerophosphotransferase family protein, partial [Atopobiaceae bacterium]|nr:CDP-glycerol glycerophosphotransferase family protein [Atopobiaceae bacterium]
SSPRTPLPGPTEAAAVTAAELAGIPYAGEPQLVAREGGDAEDLWLVSASQSGSVSATRLGPSVRLDGCAVENTTINLRVSWPYDAPAPSAPTLWLVGREHGARTALDTAPDGEGTWIASLDLSDPSSTKALRDDEYRLSLGSEGGGTRYHVVGGADRRSTRLNSGGYSYELDMMGAEPLLRVAHERTWDEGRLRQLAVERVAYPVMRLLPLRRDLVLFESVWATSVGCSPKALYDYIDNEHDEYRCIWSVRDTRIPVGGRAEVVRQGSFGYYLALARAGFLVSNVNFPEYYVKRRGQVEVQTMHGTPLKTMGIDVRSEIPNKEAADRLLSICSRWDYLVVQSRRVEEITRRCFGFEKTFLRTGYPRNDSLLRRNGLEEQRRLKERMGVDPDSRLVLYAPTWRARGRFDLELDIARLERDLGGHYHYAIRRHYMAVPRMSGGERLGGAVDLTYGWSVDDCMLAADVVVTDYSSIMFDYALLGRPMLFYCYDLESYRDDLRGLYVDFESEAPGPILRTTAEVAEALAGIEDVRSRYRERYEAFVSGFLEYESDHSSRDVFEQVFAR